MNQQFEQGSVKLTCFCSKEHQLGRHESASENLLSSMDSKDPRTALWLCP